MNYIKQVQVNSKYENFCCIWFQQAINNNVVITNCLMQYFCYFTRLRACEIRCKIWETWKIFPILHSAPCDNNYLLLLPNVKKTTWCQWKYLNWNLKMKLIKLILVKSQCHEITQTLMFSSHFSCLQRYCTPARTSYFMKFYELLYKNITLKKPKAKVKSRSKVMPVLVFYLWHHLWQTIRTVADFLYNSSLSRNTRVPISGQVF